MTQPVPLPSNLGPFRQFQKLVAEVHERLHGTADFGMRHQPCPQVWLDRYQSAYTGLGIGSPDFDVPFIKVDGRAAGPHSGKACGGRGVGCVSKLGPLVGMNAPRLSLRLRQVADRLCLGLTDAEIAADLRLSRHTVDGYMRVLRLAFDCTNRVALALRYAEHRRNETTNPRNETSSYAHAKRVR